MEKEKIMKIKKIKTGFFTDFKKFISRGNVIDLAVGVVIGGSFGKIVTGLVNFVINPFVGIFAGTGSLDSLKTVITPSAEAVLDEAGAVITPAVTEVAILWGNWLQTIVDFLITALCVFVFTRLIMRAKNVLEADRIEAENKKAAEAKAQAEKDKEAAAEAAAVAAAHRKELEDSIMRQEKYLAEISAALQKR